MVDLPKNKIAIDVVFNVTGHYKKVVKKYHRD